MKHEPITAEIWIIKTGSGEEYLTAYDGDDPICSLEGPSGSYTIVEGQGGERLAHLANFPDYDGTNFEDLHAKMFQVADEELPAADWDNNPERNEEA